MIISEKVRAMNKQQKFQYFFNRFLSDDIGENQKQEAITVISELMKGTPIDKIGEEFGVNCSYDLKSTPATLTLSIPGTTDVLTFDINAQDRDQFEGAQPEAQTRPIKSMLTEEEQRELLNQMNDITVTR